MKLAVQLPALFTSLKVCVVSPHSVASIIYASIYTDKLNLSVWRSGNQSHAEPIGKVSLKRCAHTFRKVAHHIVIKVSHDSSVCVILDWVLHAFWVANKWIWRQPVVRQGLALPCCRFLGPTTLCMADLLGLRNTQVSLFASLFRPMPLGFILASGTPCLLQLYFYFNFPVLASIFNVVARTPQSFV